MLKTVNRLLSYIGYYKKQFILGSLFLLVASALELSSPMVAKNVIDQVLTPAYQQKGLAVEKLIILLMIYLGLNLFGSLFKYYSILILQKMSNRIVKRMRNELFESMHRLPVSYFDRMPAGKIVARITSDTETLSNNFYVQVISNLLSNFIQIVGAYFALILLNVKLGSALLLLIPIMIIWQHFYTKFSTKINLAMREYVSQISGQINEFVQGIAIIQSFQREQLLMKEFTETVKKWVDMCKKSLLLNSSLAWGFSNLLRNFTILFVLSALSYAFLGEGLPLSAGILYVFIDYVNRLFDPIDGIIQTFANVQQSLAAGQRIFEFADQEPESQESKVIDITSGRVAFNHVSFGYEEDQIVLNDIDFSAESGETVALVGHTGSGKSSILNLLFRFYDPQKGDITIDDQVIHDYNRKSIRESMAIVMQDPYLFTGTIASNISMNHPEITESMIIKAMEQVGADYLIDRYPKGIYHPVIEKGSEFSSGERQLISFARALVVNPKILILDEATSHVDTETESTIQKAMSVLKEGRTTFMIAHRLSTIKDANQILVLDRGEIVERGNHQSLLKQEGIYHQMYQMQAEQL